MTESQRLQRGVLLLLAYCAIFFVPYYTALFYQVAQRWGR
jgi:putative effector of murein hydrolase LrgA (UPF0299 family)